MSQPTPALSIANPRLLGLVRETVLSPLLDAFADTIDGLREPLLAEADRLEVDRMPFLDGMFTLRQQRDAMLAAYRAHLVRAWQALESGTPLSAELRFEDEAVGLDLVQHDELEMQLAIHHLAEVLAREWKSELLSLNSYLAWVDPGLRMDADSNPFSPAQISIAVYHGFAHSKLVPKVRLAAVRCCERDLVELVGPIYEAVHACLMREFGVPDKLSARSRHGAHIPSSETEEDAEEPDWLTRFFIQWSDDAGQAGASQAAAAAKAVDSTLPPALHQLLEESRAAREQVQGAPKGSTARTTLSQRELISILTLLQIASDQTLAAIVQPQGSLLERLKRQMFELARLLGVEPGAVKLAEADENIVDLIGMLFQVMFDECDLTRGQREVLGKLIAPMTKVALQDRQLFLQSSHPARRLLNILAEACEGNHGETEEEKALLQKVEATVTRLVADFNESQSVFRTLRGDFNSYYGEYRRAAELAEREAAERQRIEEALEKARLAARATLDARLEGRALPLPVKYLLHAGWVPYAAGLEVNGRMQAALSLMDGFLQAVESARKGDPTAVAGWQAAVDWMQPVWMAATRDKVEIAGHRTTLLEALQHMGRTPTAVVPATTAAPIVDPAAEPASLGQAYPELPVASVIGPLTAEELQEAVDFDNVTAEYFSGLAVGTWLDFIDKDNKAQPGKLSWISPISSRLMFVSRTGARICVASAQELAIMVKLKRLRLHRDDDAFYSAMQGVIDRLEPVAA
jgi:hypothetical protein